MSIFKNWEQTKEVLLDGLTGSKRDNVAQILENQKKEYLKETAGADVNQVSQISNFQNIVIPMIRRIIPGTIGTELVGVQAMNGPVGLAYSMRFEFNNALDTGAVLTNIAAGNEVFGNNSKTRRFYSGGMTAGTDTNFFTSDDVATGQAADTGLFESYPGRTMSLRVLKQTITAGSRKLSARMTMEAQQDLDKQWGIDLESELSGALSSEIISEIDNEIITDLTALANTVDSYDMNSTSFTGTPNYVGDRHAVLGVIISRVANEIARLTRRGAGNFVVVSPVVATVLQSASRSVFAPAVQGSFESPTGTRLIGTLNGTIKVYSYLYHDQGTEAVLVGYKGSSELDSGYFYCPYIPLTSAGSVRDINTFDTATMMMTRYGKCTFTSTATSLGNSADYYGRISIANLSFF